MGMYDSVIATCPKCSKNIEFQSKVGQCDLKRYHYKNVPMEIAVDLDASWESTEDCCNTKWVLVIKEHKRIEMEIKDKHKQIKEWD